MSKCIRRVFLSSILHPIIGPGSRQRTYLLGHRLREGSYTAASTHRDIDLSVCDAIDVVSMVGADAMQGHSMSLESITATA
jgi:hypothetical protein